VIKKNRTKEPREEKKRTKQKTLFVMSPDGFFVFFNSPCPLLNKSMKKKKIEQVTTFCFSAAANARHFRHFIFLRPPLAWYLALGTMSAMVG
jgi:hypothetical protein